MDETQKLLQSIVENARTGMDACEQLLKKTEDAGLRDELMEEKGAYEGFAREAEQALFAAGAEPHAKGPLARAGMWMGIQMNTMTDTTDAHIAEMLIQGAAMGVAGMTRDRNDLPDADKHAHDIAANFITAQEEAMQRLKKFL